MTRRSGRRNGGGGRTLGGGSAATAPAPGIEPIPSLLDGRTYKILDSAHVGGGAWVERTGDSTGRMAVPLGAGEADRRIRLHEMAHVRWTPVAPSLPDGVSHATMNAVEDRRMHRRLRETGYQASLDAPIFSTESWDALDRQFAIHADTSDERLPMTDLDVARLIVASEGTAEGEGIREMAEGWNRGWMLPLLDGILDRSGLRGRRPAWKRTVEAAAEIDALFSELEDLPEEVRNRLPEYQDDAGQGTWGEMEIREMPLPDRLPRNLKERVRRATDRGAVPRNWHRMISDGAVFSRRVSRPGGGTVLIDQSGSMHLDADEVLDLMAQFPGVLVATYAGRGGRGVLRVIARNGRRASRSDCLIEWNGNVIDGPALDWLNEQPGPRVWVSDGAVTGAGANPLDPRLLLDAASKVREGKIIRADRVGDLLSEGGIETTGR